MSNDRKEALPLLDEDDDYLDAHLTGKATHPLEVKISVAVKGGISTNGIHLTADQCLTLSKFARRAYDEAVEAQAHAAKADASEPADPGGSVADAGEHTGQEPDSNQG